MGAMDALEVLQKDAVEWKKRALKSEALLSNYRKCFFYADQVVRARVEASQRGVRPEMTVEDAIDELQIEVGMVEQLDPPPAFYDQNISVDGMGGDDLTIRQVTGLEGCSKLDIELGVVEIKQNQPEEGKAIGLLFQLLQLSDLGSAAELQTERALSAERLHLMAPVLLVLLRSTGFLHPAVGVSPTSIIRFVDEGQAAASAN